MYGSLAQRAPTSRHTIRRLCEADLLRVFDVNLRPPFVDRSVIERSLQAADVVKCNDDELWRLRDWFDLPDGLEAATTALAAAFDCSAICVTAGSDGAWLWMNDVCSHHPGYAADVEDTVGAGDAFLAALLAGLLSGRNGKSLLDLANRLGAFVASRSGALPPYSVDTLGGIADLPLNP